MGTKSFILYHNMKSVHVRGVIKKDCIKKSRLGFSRGIKAVNFLNPFISAKQNTHLLRM